MDETTVEPFVLSGTNSEASEKPEGMILVPVAEWDNMVHMVTEMHADIAAMKAGILPAVQAIQSGGIMSMLMPKRNK